jgi:phenylalanyl-tRNA synthetase beta chain
VGGVDPEQWGQPSKPADFFALKADLEAILSLTGAPERFAFVPASHPALHPGQPARIERDGQPVGLIGMLHPAIAVELDLTGDAFLFELDQTALGAGQIPRFRPISRFPAIRRDIAVLVDREVPFAAIAASIRAEVGDLLRDLVPFDVYVGGNIDAGRKSLALGLILQASSQTLTDEAVEETVGRAIARLGSEFGAKLRD